MKDTITKEKVFNHPIDKVWDAISKAEDISIWFLQADFKAEKGYQYTFTHNQMKKDAQPFMEQSKKQTLTY